MLLSVAGGLALLFGLFVYGQVYYPPIKYDADMIRVGQYNWETNEFTDSGDWYVMSKYSRVVDCSRVVEHVNADGSLQIWAFINYKKDALWDRLFSNYGDFSEIIWISGLNLYPPPFTPYLKAEKVYATVYWMDDIEKFDSLQIIARETDHLSKEALALCTLIWEGAVKGD